MFLPFAQAEEDFSEEKEVIIYFFDDRLCPVCKSAKEFIQSLQQEYPQIELMVYPISDTGKLNEIAKKYGREDYKIMAPTIFIGGSDYETGNFFQFRDFTSQHEEMVVRAIKGEIVEEDCCIVKIPFLDIEIDIRDWSLPLATIILGSLDGLNICSIGALILILSIVIFFNSKRKILFCGGLFIITTAVVYGVLVFAWGRLFEALVGRLEILRIIVGLAAFCGGVYFFKESWKFFKHGPTCQTLDSALARKATDRLKKAFDEPEKGFFFLAAAVMFFAVVITVVELPCSVGVPIAFTGILAEAGVSLATYVFYILFYLFFYMLIEIIIFIGAVLTKKIWFAGSKVITYITFTGALVLFYLAFYYLFYY